MTFFYIFYNDLEIVRNFSSRRIVRTAVILNSDPSAGLEQN